MAMPPDVPSPPTPLTSTPPERSPFARGSRRAIPLAWRVVNVRMRFIVVLGVAFLVVAEWDVIGNYWEKITRPSGGPNPATQAVSVDTEYFCPMDPGVISDWPGK